MTRSISPQTQDKPQHHSQGQSPQVCPKTWIYALAIGTNYKQQQSVNTCLQQLDCLGQMAVSPIYQTAPEDGIGEDYLNLAVLLTATLIPEQMAGHIKKVESDMGRIKKSRMVLIDIDMIAYGQQLHAMTLVSRRLPLADYVTMPLATLWADFETVLRLHSVS